MKRDLGPLLARVSVNEIETQHDAVGRLVKILAEARDTDDGVADACTALFDLLASPRLAVVSKACHGLGHLLASESSVVDLAESVDWLVRAVEAAMARQEDQRQRGGGESGSGGGGGGGGGGAGGTPQSEVGGVTQALTRCVVSATRQLARREAKELAAGRLVGEEGGERGGGGGIMATLLAMERGLLYPALSHEATCFVGRRGTDPREVVRVVGPLAAAVLLQPEYANLRGGFLLKLSAASATASDDVKLCLVVLQAELLGFCAVHTAAHADVAAGWFGALGSTALSLDSDGAWERASRAVCGVAVFLVAEFRERGFPVAPLLDSLLRTVAADPLCVADEVAFLAITALQSACVNERETLLEIVGLAVSAMPRCGVSGTSGANGAIGAPYHPAATMTATTPPPRVGGRADDLCARSWSLEALVYPVVSMAAAGNAAAAAVLPPLEAALGGGLSGDGAEEVVRAASAVGGSGMEARGKPLRYCSAVALGIRRLSAREGDGEAPAAAAAAAVACEGLRRRASELGRAKGGSGSVSARESAAAVADVECSFCVLAPLLLRPCDKRVLSAACAAVVAVVRAIPSLGVRLLPFVLYAIRRRGGVVSEDGGALLLLQILPELGAHKVAAKPVAGVVQALAKAPQAAVRGVGLRLAAALIRINSRTFNQLKALLLETPVDHRPPSPPEPDESRLCRAAGMLDVCTSDPEIGVECVRSLQALLADSSGAVTALALKAIAALCRSDCLDFDAALRIVTRKGKVAHTGRDGSGSGGGGGDGGKGGGGDAGGSKVGDPRVVESLAQLCGAGAEAATMAAEDEEEDEAGESDSDGSGAGGDTRWAMEKAVMILLEKSVRSHPDETVRAAVYAALAAHLPALLQAEAGPHADEGAAKVAAAVREFLGQAMLSEPGVAAARPSLQNAAAIVLTAESADPSTWAPSKRPGARREGGGKATQERSGPSNRLLAALPTPASVLQAFRDDPACPGLAGAALWSYPPTATVAAAAATAMADRDTMARDLRELMAAEGTRGGLALCPWQRAATPLGVQRYVARFFAACLAAESADAARRGRAGRGADVATAAVESCRGAIRSLRGVSQGLVAVASASLASVVPASFSHVVVEEADRAIGRLSGGSAGGGGGAQTLLDGEEMFPLCAAMAARALPAAAAPKVADVLDAVEDLLGGGSGGGGGGGGSGGGGGVRARKSGDVSAASEPQAFWARVAIGVTSEWSLRHPTAPEARSTLSRAARVLLEGAAAAVGSDQVLSIARAWFPDGVGDVASGTERVMVEWDGIDVGGVGGKGVGAELGLPSTSQGSICLALFLGLSSTLPGLRATGMHSELRQVFNIVRAFQEAGVCGAALCLATAASEGLSCGLVDSPAVLGCLRSISLALDGSSPAALPGDRGELSTGRPPAQDAYLGAAGLVATCERRKVILPPGFAESVFESLRRTAAHRRGAKSGIRVASLLALASMIGCPLLGPGEFAPRRSRVSSAASRRTVEALSKDIQEAMEGTSLRPKNAAARVWGCLSAVGQDERSVGNPTLQASLGWAEGGEMLGTYSSGGGGGGGSGGVGGGGVTGSIAPGALYVAREGTLMNLVLTGLQSVASGVHAGGVEAQEEGPKQDEDQNGEGKKQEKGENPKSEQEKGKQEKAKMRKGEQEKDKRGEEAAAPSHPSLFAASAVACLKSCPSLRVPHLQMAAVVEALFRGGHGATVETGCISLALALADKEQAYSTWLRGLFRWELFANLSREARRHLVSVFDEIVAKVPSGTARGLVEEVWNSLASSFVCPVSEDSASRGGGGIYLSSAEGIAQGAAFLSALGRRLVTAAAAAVAVAGAEGEAAEAGAGDEIRIVTTETFLPYFMDAFASLDDGGDGYLAALDRDAPEAPLWDALVGLLSRLPRRGVEDAIAFKAGAAAAGGPSSENPSRQAVRAYLVSRVAAVAERAAGQSQFEGGASSAGAATATTAGIGSVARWAAQRRTDQGASAAVLPRLVEGLKRVDTAPARGKWFQTLLDTAALPESCPTRAAVLVSGASAAWEPSSLGLLVVGEEVKALSGRGLRDGNREGAIWYSMSVTSPRAVAEVEKGSPGSSAEVLARLFKLSGLLSRRRQEAAGEAGSDDEGGGKGLEEVRWGVEGFIRGLRHSPPVLKGTLSRQFALFAESTAAEEALSCV